MNNDGRSPWWSDTHTHTITHTLVHSYTPIEERSDNNRQDNKEEAN